MTRPSKEDDSLEDENGNTEDNENNPVKIVEREINLVLINDKLNFIISKLPKN